ncbi:MAG: type II toxin-antitoxin system HicA family toxin [Candidatus Nealsonbacteria bacterium CG08_land_8_20_14_0_20_38_20]|uniref:Type II toxin-antitoxin system HicA family toxin n=1 Tax=Candidatus Nealsonbacteria bacterium CG08_land_8_20_14_0_20_38_20 TaxID=1974705 RepID=A0A2H0YM94_9BACT|nr:MAG: type II toxin-antitoxin system HicA family toxin [Candidatus Nealsonbacteria bacterium CG08_land_8_20_14_0_20_38_20]
MTKITPIHYKKLVKIFESEGFELIRVKGDHLIYIKAGISRPIVIPKYREIPVFVIKNNLRAAGINRGKYLEILKRI